MDVPISSIERVAIDAHLSRAWPAIARKRIGDLELRFGGGYGRRSNSARRVHEAGSVMGPDLEAIARVEREYRAVGLVPAFYVVPSFGDEALEHLLRARGYVASEPFFVWAAAVDAVLAHRPRGEASVSLLGAPAAELAETLSSIATGKATDARRLADLLEHAQPPMRLAMARDPDTEGAPLACAALASIDGDHVSIHELVTAPRVRRRGFARDLVLAIVERGRREGASRACAQIAAHNGASEALFESLSFRRLHGYHYLSAPSDPPSP